MFEVITSVSIPCELFLVCLLTYLRFIAVPAATFIELSSWALLIKDGIPFSCATPTREVCIT